jgi:hypothetical protein
MQPYKILLEVDNLWDLIKRTRDQDDAALQDLKELDKLVDKLDEATLMRQ